MKSHFVNSFGSFMGPAFLYVGQSLLSEVHAQTMAHVTGLVSLIQQERRRKVSFVQGSKLYCIL